MRFRIVICIVVLALASGSAKPSVLGTPHNLSSGGPGTYTAVSNSEVCVFCHTPHNSDTQSPLWNRNEPGGPYLMYWSRTMDAYTSAASAPQPSGSSKMCLSCHDGTIALGSTKASGSIAMSGGVTTLPVHSPAFLGLDLSGDHPVSFQVTDSLISDNNAKGDVLLKSLAQIRAHPDVNLDAADRIQCATCHDPHDNQFGSFLAVATTGDLCLACHT